MPVPRPSRKPKLALGGGIRIEAVTDAPATLEASMDAVLRPTANLAGQQLPPGLPAVFYTHPERYWLLAPEDRPKAGSNQPPPPPQTQPQPIQPQATQTAAFLPPPNTVGDIWSNGLAIIRAWIQRYNPNPHRGVVYGGLLYWSHAVGIPYSTAARWWARGKSRVYPSAKIFSLLIRKAETATDPRDKLDPSSLAAIRELSVLRHPRTTSGRSAELDGLGGGLVPLGAGRKRQPAPHAISYDTTPVVDAAELQTGRVAIHTMVSTLGMDLVGFCIAAGVGYRTVANYLGGVSVPRREVFKAIAGWAGGLPPSTAATVEAQIEVLARLGTLRRKWKRRRL